MDNKDRILSMTLRNEADSLGLCEEWHNAWQDNSTQQELINKYLRGIDFCLQHHWPSNGFIKSHFDKALLRKNNILVDDRRSLLNPPMAIILGNSHAIIRVVGNNPSRIYLNGNTEASLYVHTNAKVIVEVRDKARLSVTPWEDRTDCVVFDYSDDTLVEASKSIKYERKDDYLKG